MHTIDLRQALVALAVALIAALRAAAHYGPENGACGFDTSLSLPIQCGQLSKLILVPIDANTGVGSPCRPSWEAHVLIN